MNEQRRQPNTIWQALDSLEDALVLLRNEGDSGPLQALLRDASWWSIVQQVLWKVQEDEQQKA